jgi:r-opsin
MSSSTINETLLPAAFIQDQLFDPWSVPDSFTVFKFAPDYVKPLLHPHWQSQKAVHPIWSYFFGLYYFVMGSLRPV